MVLMSRQASIDGVADDVKVYITRHIVNYCSDQGFKMTLLDLEQKVKRVINKKRLSTVQAYSLEKAVEAAKTSDEYKTSKFNVVYEIKIEQKKYLDCDKLRDRAQMRAVLNGRMGKEEDDDDAAAAEGQLQHDSMARVLVSSGPYFSLPWFRRSRARATWPVPPPFASPHCH